ncbi:hypothetical protein [Limnospira fusiformis]
MENPSSPIIPPAWIAGIIWMFAGMGLLAIGAILWFHLPYLLFLDEWHALWAMVSLTIGLFTGQVLFDRLVDWIREPQTDTLHPILARFGWITLAILSVAIAIGFTMKLIGWGNAMIGLLNLSFGIAFLWSSRQFWRFDTTNN